MRRLVAVLCAAAVLTLVACGGSSAATPQTTTGSPVPNVAATQPPAESAYAIEAVAIADPSSPIEFYTPEPNTRPVAVEVVVSNLSAGETVVNPVEFVLVDSGGYVHDVAFTATERTLSMTTLYTGDKVRGWLAFTVPTGATAAFIRWQHIGGPTIQAAIVP